MENHGDNDYDLMPGLYDENSDFFDSFTMNMNESATSPGDLLSSKFLENEVYTAIPRSVPYTADVQNDIASNNGFQVLPLSDEEIEAIQRLRALQQRSLTSPLSLAPTPYQDANFVFSNPELDFAGPSSFNFETGAPITFTSNEMEVFSEVEVLEPSGAVWAPLHDAPQTSTNQSNHHTPPKQHPSQDQHGPGTWQCPRHGCHSKTYFTNAALNRHLRDVHDDPLVCKVWNCSHKKPFSRKSDLRRHTQSVHSQDREHVCTFLGCGAEFSRKDHLSKHIRDKHPTYLCPVNHCRRGLRERFTNSEDLTKHLDTEHGNYECAIKACAKTSSSNFTLGSLSNHIRSHHGGGVYTRIELFDWLKRNGLKTFNGLGFHYELNECKACGKVG